MPKSIRNNVSAGIQQTAAGLRLESAMSENDVLDEKTQDEATEPQGEEQEPEIDWKEQSRKWEKLAKKGKAAEEELAALKEQQMTENERLKARAEKAENELALLTAEREKMDAAKEISQQTGVPSNLLAFCADRDAMEDFAAVYKESAHVSAAPRMQTNRVVRDKETPTSTRDVFADMAENVF